MISLRAPAVLLLLLLQGGVLAASKENPGGIAPTVTPQMGDTGGRYFGKAPDPKKVRHYFVAAEPALWDFAPEISDAICGKPLPPSAQKNHQMVNKIRYVEYKDASFTAKVLPTPRLGILGPVLRGVVGEYIVVTFLNRSSQPLSMHPHGVRYDKDSEGANYPPNPGKGAAVGPGATFTYVWYLDANAGPQPGEPSSKAWLYHSHVSGDSEVNLGLVGCIIVTDPARARPDGTPKDVDREMATLYLIFDESGLDAVADEAYERPRTARPAATRSRTWAEVMELTEQGERYAINGFTFGNLPGLDMNEGERVRWYLFSLGSEQDFHTAHWHGLTVLAEGRRTDVVELLPASMKVADMLADNPGTWLLHCHVAEHMTEGMFARYTVHAKGAGEAGREPSRAFLGLAQSGGSLQVNSAELIPGKELRLSGSVTVPDNFSIFGNTLAVELSGRALRFEPDPTGVGTTEGCTFRVRNVNPVGLVEGGVLEFEIVLQGSAWKTKLDAFKPGTALPVTLRLGSGKHGATVKLTEAK